MTILEDLVGAQGKFALFVASLLQRAGVAQASEFVELLDLYAQTVAETDPAQGRILRSWAAAVRAGHLH